MELDQHHPPPSEPGRHLRVTGNAFRLVSRQLNLAKLQRGFSLVEGLKYRVLSDSAC